MKKSLLFLAFAPLTLFGQIVITNADVPNGPSTFQLSTALTAPGFDPNDTGPNHTWDFSSLQSLNTASEDFVSVSSTPFAYQFLFNNPFDAQYQSSHAAPQDGISAIPGFEISDIYTYYKNTGNDYRLTGMGISLNGIPLAAKSQPVDKIYQFPLEYGDQTSAYTTTTFDVPTLLLYKMKQTRSNHVDGWGTITTPGGTFDVLRVKTTLEITDSLSMEIQGFPIDQELPRPETIEYKWLANGYKVPVLTITTTMGQVTGVRYYSSPTSVENQPENNHSVSLYPNPTADFIVLHGLDANSPYEIFSFNGRKIASGLYSGRISTDNLIPGSYCVSFQAEGKLQKLSFVKH